jgi:hypothetical protein
MAQYKGVSIVPTATPSSCEMTDVDPATPKPKKITPVINSTTT